MIVIKSLITLVVEVSLVQSIVSSIVSYMDTGHLPLSFSSERGLGHCHIKHTTRKKRLNRFIEELSYST
jgi:hypothetical protein